jgi:hypothetical protein
MYMTSCSIGHLFQLVTTFRCPKIGEHAGVRQVRISIVGWMDLAHLIVEPDLKELHHMHG